MWTLAFWHHEDRTPTHGYAATAIELATKTVLARSRFAVALLNLVRNGPHDASGGQPDSQHHRTAP